MTYLIQGSAEWWKIEYQVLQQKNAKLSAKQLELHRLETKAALCFALSMVALVANIISSLIYWAILEGR